MKKRFFVVAAVIISNHLHAQNNWQPSQEDTTSRPLNEVILTANKYPQKQTETGKVISVITAKQLEKSQGLTLPEVLNAAVGTTIIGANNNLGTNQTVSIRGASAGNTLILLDGIPVNDPSVITNYFDLNLLAIDQIERIEILKGGQSTLYGSDAVAGVINIISKKAGTKSFGWSGALTGGSYNTFKQSLSINGRKKLMDYSAGYTHMSSKGFSAAYDESGNKNFDKDGFNQHAANARLGFNLSERVKASVFGTYTFYKTDLDASAFTDEKDYTVKNNNGQAGAGITYNHDKGALHFNYNFNYVERNYLDDSGYVANPYSKFSRSSYIGRTHYAELYNNWKLKNWELLAGADYRFNNTAQYYFSTGSFGPYEPPVLNAKMSQISPYASIVYKNGTGFTAEAGGRLNHHSEYGNNFTYTINPSYLFANRAKIFANFYSAFKAPTLYQLFDPSAGNPDLAPEKSTIIEGGVEILAIHNFTARVVGFNRDTKNSIQYILINPTTYESRYRNISKQTNYGAELELAYNTNRFNITANYTYTDGKTKSAYDGTGVPIGKDTTYYNLYRIPKHAVNFSLGWQATRALYLRTDLHTRSEREEFIYGAAPKKLDGYATIDLYGEYRVGRGTRFFVDLKNLTDKKYFDILGYNSRRFNFMAGASFQF